MKKSFGEYHQFTEDELKKMWNNCLFVFDANVLLHMYRYSRQTVNDYLKAFKEFKNKQQLWIPYQIGYEFHENRINVIDEYEKSYDSILSILNKAKSDMENKYRNHPFLDLSLIKEQIETGLSKVEEQIINAQKIHPSWMKKDDVLEEINKFFENNVGQNFTEKKINEIKKEGEKRYENKIPPGYKDNNKPEKNKYGDLILWFQIIDKAKKEKKPIIFISGDEKKDWWLEKNGEKIMPLSQLKKELLDKAGVDFHMYTADNFLEHYKANTKDKKIKIANSSIKEVRELRKLEEDKLLEERLIIRNKCIPHSEGKEKYISEQYSLQFYLLDDLMSKITEIKDIDPTYKNNLKDLHNRLSYLRNKFLHGATNRNDFELFYSNIKETIFTLENLLSEEKDNSHGLFGKIVNYLNATKHSLNKIRHLNLYD